MTTPFKAKAEGVLVEVHEDDDHFSIRDNQLWYTGYGPPFSGLKYSHAIDLPPGDWQLVGTSDTMTEDEWKGIVESRKGIRHGVEVVRFCNYKNKRIWFSEPSESGHSLLPDPSKRYAVILKKNK